MREENRESKEGAGEGEEGRKRGGEKGSRNRAPTVIESRRLWRYTSCSHGRQCTSDFGKVFPLSFLSLPFLSFPSSLSSPFQLPSSLSFPSPLIQLGDLGSAVSSPSGSGQRRPYTRRIFGAGKSEAFLVTDFLYFKFNRQNLKGIDISCVVCVGLSILLYDGTNHTIKQKILYIVTHLITYRVLFSSTHLLNLVQLDIASFDPPSRRP